MSMVAIFGKSWGTRRSGVLWDDQGSATIVAVGFISALIALAGALGIGAQLLCEVARAQVAADMAAVAGVLAFIEGNDACESASQLAQANHAKLRDCAVDAGDVQVTVVVGRRSASSRAGTVP